MRQKLIDDLLAALKLGGASATLVTDHVEGSTETIVEAEQAMGEVEQFKQVKAGTIVVNGVEIAFDPFNDSVADVLRRIAAQFNGAVRTVYSTRQAVEESVKTADLVIGCVLIPGAAAPKLITKKMLKTMKPGSVIVDVAIDQGGCCETSKATTHANPTYVVDGVIHYCVANMPGAVARCHAISKCKSFQIGRAHV